MPKVPADFCLSCGYSLVGLPTRHRCPECGQEYDEHIRVWKPARPKTILFASFAFMGGFCGLMPNAIRMMVSGSGWSRGFGIAITLLYAVIVTLVLVKAFDRKRRGYRVCLSAEGVEVRGSNVDQTVAWTDIVRVKRGEHSGRRSARLATMLERANDAPVGIFYFFASDEEAKDFLSEFESARRHYLGLSAGEEGAGLCRLGLPVATSSDALPAADPPSTARRSLSPRDIP